jgi:ubiquitin carboxyl-terminal hydrolase 10
MWHAHWLTDSRVMFMHEYKVIRSAPSIEQLRRSLKHEELEKYGEPFTPEFVYEAIRQLPRFASMRVRTPTFGTASPQ